MIASLAACALTMVVGAVGGMASAAETTRTYGGTTPFIARTVTVPAGYETVYLSGMLPDLPPAPQPAGDAEAQAANVLAKIGAVLREQGLTEADVVSMTVYMWAPPGERMDFDGMMRAYSKLYGTPTQPNRPARSTVQVMNLGAPRALLEIEVTAVRKPR